MQRPALVSLIAAVAFARVLLAQGGGFPAADAPLASAERTERPAPAAEWKEGADLVRAFVSSERSASAPALGDWWALESAPAPEGFVLKSATFHLVGDRACAGTEAS